MPQRSSPESSDGHTETLMLGYLCVKDAVTLTEKVAILDRFGLTDAEIAVICAATAGSVRNARLSRKKISKVPR
jgi:L-asparaginase II